MREIAAALYEDKYNISIKNQIQTLKVDLIKTFSDIGFPDTVINQRNSLSIRVEDLDCDYYKFMNMDITAVNSYQGSYMERYYWAEFSLGYFDEVLKSEYYC